MENNGRKRLDTVPDILRLPNRRVNDLVTYGEVVELLGRLQQNVAANFETLGNSTAAEFVKTSASVGAVASDVDDVADRLDTYFDTLARDIVELEARTVRGRWRRFWYKVLRFRAVLANPQHWN